MKAKLTSAVVLAAAICLAFGAYARESMWDRTADKFIADYNSGGPEFWGEVQPPASLKGLDIPARPAI